jgi:hypothetical protein
MMMMMMKIRPQVNKNSPHFMEPEGALLCLLQPVICPIISQMNPFHAILPHCLQICSTTIPASRPTYSKPCASFRFPHQNPIFFYVLLHTFHTPRLTPPGFVETVIVKIKVQQPPVQALRTPTG